MICTSISAAGRCSTASTWTSRGASLVGLIGPNGAGKTTLVRSVLGLLRPRAGTVRVDGQVVRPRRAGIGYVPQRTEFAWDFPISVEQVVMTGLVARHGLLRRPGVEAWRAVGRALDLVRMTDLRARPVGELSGGQRQRGARRPGVSCSTRACSCSTSRSRVSTSRPRTSSWSCSPTWRARTGRC